MMEGSRGFELPMIEEGPRYHRAYEATVEILNLHIFDPANSKSELVGKVLFIVLSAMYQAEEDLYESRSEPSEN
jgi:hypothetical protein